MNSEIIQVVKDALNISNVSPHIIEQTPTLVKRAVIKLQKKKILPPRILEFQSIDKKEEKRIPNGEVFYNYFRLPDDFRTLEEFYVHDDSQGADDSINHRVPYLWVNYENYLNNRDTDDRGGISTRKWFSITDINREDEGNVKILVANPFPDNDTFIQIKYFPDGTDTSYEYFKSDHWEPIIRQVESILGIRSREDADQEAQDENTAWRNQKGKTGVNGTLTKTKIRYPFSGRTNSLRDFRRNNNRRRR